MPFSSTIEKKLKYQMRVRHQTRKRSKLRDEGSEPETIVVIPLFVCLICMARLPPLKLKGLAEKINHK